MDRLKELETELQQLMKGGFASADAYQRFEEVRVECRQLAFDQKVAAGDFGGALCLCDSQEVAGTIIRLAPLMSDEVLRDTLRYEWPRCEAHRPYRAELVCLFRRVGFVCDSEADPNFADRVTVYRGNLGEKEPVGISWTLDRERAKWFSTWSQSPRAAFLGIDTRGIPTVWQGVVDRNGILGYFTGRGEEEVVLDPQAIQDVRRLSAS